jgi:hypothetical protein
MVNVPSPRLPASSFVVQDLSGPLAIAKTNFQRVAPEAWKMGRITLQQHDFFTPQPQTGGDNVFLFRWVL